MRLRGVVTFLVVGALVFGLIGLLFHSAFFGTMALLFGCFVFITLFSWTVGSSGGSRR